MPSSSNPSKTVVIIAPDKLSGDIYYREFQKIYPDCILVPAKIRPRVISHPRPPRLNKDDHGIGQDIANVIQNYYHKGYRFFTVACNTAAYHPYAHYTSRILTWRSIPNLLINHRNITKFSQIYNPQTAYLLTNTSAIKIVFNPNNLPLFLGTYPLTCRLSDCNYHTLIGHHQRRLTHLVQEIIWRIKATAGDDVSTASKEITQISDPKILDTKILNLGKQLQKLKLNRIIMGCTELPYAFSRLKNLLPSYQPTLFDPAIFVADILNILIKSI